MPLTRRHLLGLSVLTGGVMLLPPRFISTVSALEDSDAFGTSRASRLFPGERLVHTDLHNHSHFSDGAGEPSQFYTRIRSAGLDVAALTDHATVAKPGSATDPNFDMICGDEPEDGAEDPCHSLIGLDEQDWQLCGDLADAANASGAFVGMRGFEWSSPTVGHSNVWFSTTWVDPLATGGLDGNSSLAAIADQSDNDPFEVTPVIATAVETLVAQFETMAGRDGVEGYYNWLLRAPSSPMFGGGSDGIFGFNHPGREAGRFADFRLEPALRDRLVSLEMFNKGDDFIYEGVDVGRSSPLVQCLDAGWKPGILGTSDEHDPDWGAALSKGKAGLWVKELSRRGVREALEARRFYATREKGLRVDAAANGQRMGSTFGHTSGRILFEIDIAQFDVSRNTNLALLDPSRDDTVPPVGEAGQRLVLQVLQTGQPLPTVVLQQDITVPGPGQPFLAVEVDIDTADGNWVLLRLCDPTREADGIPEEDTVPSDSPYRSAGRGVVYTSPWYLRADVAPPLVTQVPGNPDAPGAPGGNGNGPDGPGGSGSDSGDDGNDADDPDSGDDGGQDPSTVPVRVDRLSGDTRITTAVAVSQAGFTQGTPAVYVATSEVFADSLVAVPAAFLDQGPLLLTRPDALPQAVREEIERLDPALISILGGPAAVSPAVEEELTAIAATRRLGGVDRYATAVEVSRARFGSGASRVGIASGEGFPDALAGGPAIASAAGPLLLTAPDSLPEVVADELERLGPDEIVVYGGVAAISAAVLDQLRTHAPNVVRQSGATRYDTAAQIAEETFARAREVLICTGEDFPDALAAGALAAQRQAPVLLVRPTAVPPETDQQIRRLAPERITIIGGPDAVDDEVRQTLSRYESG